MPRPFTRRQADENARFLEALRATGNSRLAARSLGVHRSTYTKRRARSAAFAQGWDAALAAAHAAFHLSGGRRPPEACPEPRRRGGPGIVAGDRCPSAGRPSSSLRTRGGEPMVVRLANGRLQLRLAPPGRMTKQGEQAFFFALSATANVRLSAAAAGFAHSSFYRRKRDWPAFAREMRLSLDLGHERLLCAMLQAALPESHADDCWRHNDPPPIPPLTADQALQLLCHHRKSVELGWDMPHRRRRRGESWETYTERLRAMWTCEQRQRAEDEAVRRAARYESTGDWRFADEAPPPPLPPLHLVTGWSKASGRPPHHEGVALFGGWRIEDMKRKAAAKGRG